MDRAADAENDNPLAAPRGLAVRLWRCSNCGYDLSGLGESGRCPECAEEYESGWLHLRGWRRYAHVPLGGRSRAQGLIAAVYLAAFTSYAVHVGMAWPIGALSMLSVAAAVFVPLVMLARMRQRRLRHVGPRPMHVFLGPVCLDATGVWRNARLGWARFTAARLKRLERGLWRLTLTGHPAETFGRELWPPDMGLWRVRIVFRGSRRDAALVRRVCRERVSSARSMPRPPRSDRAPGRSRG